MSELKVRAIKVQAECPRCEGAGTVGHDGARYSCGKCFGTGTVERWLPITDLAQMLGVPQSVVTATLARVAA